jgi:hypothetical protein
VPREDPTVIYAQRGRAAGHRALPRWPAIEDVVISPSGTAMEKLLATSLQPAM